MTLDDAGSTVLAKLYPKSKSPEQTMAQNLASHACQCNGLVSNAVECDSVLAPARPHNTEEDLVNVHIGRHPDLKEGN